VNTQNYFYDKQYLTDKFSEVSSETEAEFMAFYMLAIHSQTLQTYTVKARCNDTGIVQSVFNIMRNTTRTYAQNYTVNCGGYEWSWSSGTKVLTVVPEGTSLRRLFDSNPDSDSRKLESFGFECTIPTVYCRVPVATCAADTYWITGFTGFRYNEASQPGAASGVSNALISARPLADATVVVYNQTGATASAFLLPILWFFGWVAFVTWDKRDKDRIYDDKRLKYSIRKDKPSISSVSLSNLKMNSAFISSNRSAASTVSTGTSSYEPSHRFEDHIEDTEETEIFHDMFDGAPTLLHEKSSLSRFYEILLREHHFLSLWSYSSLALPRNIRYLALWSHILVILFISTIFITVIATASRDCTVLITQAECQATTERLSAVQQQFSSLLAECDWSEGRHECSRAALPYTFGFVTLFTAASLLLATVINSFLWNFFWVDICAKQPRLEEIGMSSNLWLDIRHKWWEEEEESLEGDASEVAPDTPDDAHVAPEYLYDEAKTLYSANSKKEGRLLIRKAIKHLRVLTTSSPALDELNGGSFDDTMANVIPTRSRRIEAITRFLHMNEDGSPRPLSLHNKIQYGSARQHVECKIDGACSNSVEIIKELNTLGHFEDDCKDIILLQHFVISQFDTLKRLALRRELLQFDHVSTGSISAVQWIFGWVLVVSINLIMLIFVGITMVLADLPEALVKAWIFLVFWAIAQEALFVIPAKLLLFHVTLVKSTQPQLRAIYHTLSAVATQWSQDSKEGSLISSADEKHSSRPINSGLDIHKHFIAACRVARMSCASDLGAAGLLRELTDCDILQCRTACDSSPNLYTKIILALPTLVAMGSDSVSLVVFDALIIIQWGAGLMLAYMVLLKVWFIFVGLILMLVGYTAYLYLVRKPYLKRLQARGASGRRTWKSRKFKRDGTAKNALRWTGPVQVVRQFVSKTNKWRVGDLQGQPSRAALAWRNMNRSDVLQGRVLSDTDAHWSALISLSNGSQDLLSAFARLHSYDGVNQWPVPRAPPSILKMRPEFCESRQVVRWGEEDMLARLLRRGLNAFTCQHNHRYNQQQLAELYNLGYAPQYIDDHWAEGFIYYNNLKEKKMKELGSMRSQLGSESDTYSCSESDTHIYDSHSYDSSCSDHSYSYDSYSYDSSSDSYSYVSCDSYDSSIYDSGDSSLSDIWKSVSGRMNSRRENIEVELSDVYNDLVKERSRTKKVDMNPPIFASRSESLDSEDPKYELESKLISASSGRYEFSLEPSQPARAKTRERRDSVGANLAKVHHNAPVSQKRRDTIITLANRRASAASSQFSLSSLQSGSPSVNPPPELTDPSVFDNEEVSWYDMHSTGHSRNAAVDQTVSTTSSLSQGFSQGEPPQSSDAGEKSHLRPFEDSEQPSSNRSLLDIELARLRLRPTGVGSILNFGDASQLHDKSFDNQLDDAFLLRTPSFSAKSKKSKKR
jgi:hypothetical protein